MESIGHNREIIALTHLIKAHLQKRSHLMNQIDILRIKNSYRSSNDSRRISVDILQKIKPIKKSYEKTKTQLFAAKEISEYKLLNESILNELLHKSNQISIFLNRFEEQLNTFNNSKDQIEKLLEKLEDSKKVLDTLHHKFEANFPAVEIIENNRAQFLELSKSCSEMKSKISILQENEKLLKLEKLGLTVNNFRFINSISNFRNLSKKKLKLRSKLLLKEDLALILYRAQMEYDKYYHYFSLEKRRIENLNLKAKKHKTEKNSFHNHSSTKAESSDFQEVKNLELKKPFMKNLTLDSLNDIIDITDIHCLTESVRSISNDLKVKIGNLSKSPNFVFN